MEKEEKKIKKPGFWDCFGTIFLFIIMVLPNSFTGNPGAFIGSIFAWLIVVYIFVPSVRRYVLQPKS